MPLTIKKVSNLCRKTVVIKTVVFESRKVTLRGVISKIRSGQNFWALLTDKTGSMRICGYGNQLYEDNYDYRKIKEGDTVVVSGCTFETWPKEIRLDIYSIQKAKEEK